MSTYYYLVNDTTKERINFNSDITQHCFQSGYAALNQAFMLYIFDHQGDTLRFISDFAIDSLDDSYEEIDISEEYKDKLKALNLWQ